MLLGMAYFLSAILVWVLTLQRLAEGPDDAKQCEGSEAISNLTEQSGV